MIISKNNNDNTSVIMHRGRLSCSSDIDLPDESFVFFGILQVATWVFMRLTPSTVPKLKKLLRRSIPPCEKVVIFSAVWKAQDFGYY